MQSLNEIDAVTWDACACPEAVSGARPNDPFTTHRFLKALEDSNSVGQGTGWHPQYLQASLGEKTIGVAPMYAKGHSQGEFIFDHNWAHAYEQAGGRYYPKLQIAVPHTPATGRRFLIHPDFEEVGLSALIQGAVQLGRNNNLSSLHVTFCSEQERDLGVSLGLLPRTTQQFHWFNKGYRSFDDFLQTLSSRKRKNIRNERVRAQNFGGSIKTFTGSDLTSEHWDAFWEFYQDTGDRKWGTPYLTRAFFDLAQKTLRDDILLVLAIRDGKPVAGALNFIGRDTLFGRYWGCTEHHDCLHFELCYYQGIEFCIENKLRLFHPGTQGEHKILRGFEPTFCYSNHYLQHPDFQAAVDDFLQREKIGVQQYKLQGESVLPFKQVDK